MVNNRCGDCSRPTHPKVFEAIAAICAVCNQANLEFKNGVFAAVGSPTEAALKVLTEKLGVPVPEKNGAIK